MSQPLRESLHDVLRGTKRPVLTRSNVDDLFMRTHPLRGPSKHGVRVKGKASCHGHGRLGSSHVGVLKKTAAGEKMGMTRGWRASPFIGDGFPPKKGGQGDGGPKSCN